MQIPLWNVCRLVPIVFQFLGFDRFGVWILHLFPHACVLEVQRRRVGERSGRRFLTVHSSAGCKCAPYLRPSIRSTGMYVCNKWWIFHALRRSSVGGGGERETARAISAQSHSRLSLFRPRAVPQKALACTILLAYRLPAGWLDGRILHVFIWICNSARTQMKHRLERPPLFHSNWSCNHQFRSRQISCSFLQQTHGERKTCQHFDCK